MITSTPVLLSAGCRVVACHWALSPLPDAESRIEPIPCPARYDFTASARRRVPKYLIFGLRCRSPQLYVRYRATGEPLIYTL